MPGDEGTYPDDDLQEQLDSKIAIGVLAGPLPPPSQRPLTLPS